MVSFGKNIKILYLRSFVNVRPGGIQQNSRGWENHPHKILIRRRPLTVVLFFGINSTRIGISQL